MAMFVAVLALVVTLTAVVLLVVDAERTSSARDLRQSSARTLANSALDEFYSNLQAGDDSELTTPDPTWYRLGPSGREACTDGSNPDFTTPCYRVDVLAATNQGTVTATNAVRVQVTVRSDCRGVKEHCRFTRFEQRLRQRDFLQFLYYTKFNALDPDLYTSDLAADLVPPISLADVPTECGDRYATARTTPIATPARNPSCVEVSFQGEAGSVDAVDGPVYTLDDYISVCGGPSFNGSVLVAGPGTGPPNPALRQATGCSGTPTIVGDESVAAPEIRLPEPQQADKLFKALAGTDLVTPTAPSTPVTVQLTDDTVSVAGVPRELPDVLVIDGDATVSGDAARPVTVYATGALTVDGDITVNDACAPPTAADGIVGLAAGGDIHITQSSPGTSRCLQAVIVALDGSVAVEDWSLDQGWGASSPPTLVLYGALVGKYQGVFGGFDATTGELNSGYRKDFHFDTRLTDNILQPPYLLAPLTGDNTEAFDVAAKWARIDTSEVAMTAACVNSLRDDMAAATC
jgi:hypothetical protein